MILMITEEQQKWLDHLSDTDKVLIVPWDPTCEARFSTVKRNIQDTLGSQQQVEHRGSSSLKISGQDEIDIYIPVKRQKYDLTVNLIVGLFGEPRSNYPLRRTRFTTLLERKHIDIFVIDIDGEDWKNSEKFYNILLNNTSVLNEYQELKEKSSGKSIREYYRKKIEFINKLLA